MQVRTFSARGMSAVLGMIREELGPDAVILDTQEEDGVVTMTVALEDASAQQAQPETAATGARAAQAYVSRGRAATA